MRDPANLICVHSLLVNKHCNSMLVHTGSGMQAFGASALCTFKLHQFVVHLVDQAKGQGATAHTMEMWVERMVGLMKTMVKFRSSECPELLFVNDWLLRVAMACMRQQFPDVCKTFDELVPAYRSTPRNERTHDGARDKFKLQLLGASSQLNPEDATLVRVALEEKLKDDAWYRDVDHGAGWSVDEVEPRRLAESATLTRYPRAMLASDDCMSCRTAATQRKKDNGWALVMYQEGRADGGEEEVWYVARMKYFVLADCTVARADGKRSSPLKLAICDLYKAQVVASPGSSTDFDHIMGLAPDLIMCQMDGTGQWAPRANYQDCLVNLAELCQQVVPTRARVIGGKTYRYFMTGQKASRRAYRSGNVPFRA